MIINHMHRFCYFAIPRTASKAISKVLVEQYNSENILRMHTSYDEFMAQASESEHNYFTFTSVRNPLDSIVSAYFKIKTDHNGRFSRGAYRDGRPLASKMIKAYKFISETDASFSEYFKRFHQEEYHKPRHESTVQKVDYVLRFEHLNRDLENVYEHLNLPINTIPKFNETAGRSEDYLKYYTPEIIPQVFQVMAPIMEKWKYDFPADWKFS